MKNVTTGAEETQGVLLALSYLHLSNSYLKETKTIRDKQTSRLRVFNNSHAG